MGESLFSESHAASLMAGINTKLVLEEQAFNTALVLDVDKLPQYHVGMGILTTLREKAGLSTYELADKVGTSQPQIWRLEKDHRKMTREWAIRIAPHVRTEPETLVFGDRSVPLVGKVEAGAGARFFGSGDTLGRARMPRGGTENTVAVELEGDSLGAGLNGWYAYYDQRRDPPTPDLIGQMCVVGLPGDQVLIKNLIAGRTEGRYDLWPVAGGTPLTDQVVEWAARVINLLPAWLAKIEDFEAVEGRSGGKQARKRPHKRAARAKTARSKR